MGVELFEPLSVWGWQATRCPACTAHIASTASDWLCSRSSAVLAQGAWLGAAACAATWHHFSAVVGQQAIACVSVVAPKLPLTTTVSLRGFFQAWVDSLLRPAPFLPRVHSRVDSHAAACAGCAMMQQSANGLDQRGSSSDSRGQAEACAASACALLRLACMCNRCVLFCVSLRPRVLVCAAPAQGFVLKSSISWGLGHCHSVWRGGAPPQYVVASACRVRCSV